MKRVLVLGAGKIGRVIAKFLAATGEYDVKIGDVSAESLASLRDYKGIEPETVDAGDAAALRRAMTGRECVISALTYKSNALVAEIALESGASYFDLTEDIETAKHIRALSERAKPGQIFMPQCGLAPGFVSILGAHLTRTFDTLDSVLLRVGALPQFPTNVMKYNLTWSTDGLVNEYCNPCDAIHEGRRIHVLPLEGLEHFSLDGLDYEAFNTSGGLGTLCEALDGRVRELNYKTCRYVGHRDLMQFLIQELRLGERRKLLIEILENAVPVNYQDVVVIFCSVTGRRKGQLVQLNDARKVYRQDVHGEPWSAIQITTAAGMCAAVDLHAAGRLPRSGFVRQEQIDFEDFIANRFGAYYKPAIPTPVPAAFEPELKKTK